MEGRGRGGEGRGWDGMGWDGMGWERGKGEEGDWQLSYISTLLFYEHETLQEFDSALEADKIWSWSIWSGVTRNNQRIAEIKCLTLNRPGFLQIWIAGEGGGDSALLCNFCLECPIDLKFGM